MQSPQEHAAWIRSCLDRFEGRLLAYARGLLGERTAAEDVVQEAFMRLCRERAERLADREAPWLYRVCRNLATDALRRRPHAPRTNAPDLDGAAPHASPSETLEVGEAARAARLAVAALPEMMREVTLLKLCHGLSYKEIAQVTGHSTGHVGVLVHEGVTILRKRLRPKPVVGGVVGRDR